MSDILSAIKATRDLLRPVQYYVVTLDIPPGRALRIGPLDDYPAVWLFHRDDFAAIGAELSQRCRIVDFRTWQPSEAAIDRAFKKLAQDGVAA